ARVDGDGLHGAREDIRVEATDQPLPAHCVFHILRPRFFPARRAEVALDLMRGRFHERRHRTVALRGCVEIVLRHMLAWLPRSIDEADRDRMHDIERSKRGFRKLLSESRWRR